MKIAIVGLGLIGGSLGKAIHLRTAHRCVGIDTNPDTIEAALADGIIEEAITPEQIGEADLVIVALHPQATIDYILANCDLFSAGQIVMDVCGVKTSVVEAVEDVLRERKVRFVGTHPMAGREFSGYEYAVETLFDKASFITTPVETTDPEALETVLALAREIGFVKTVETSPEHHDRVIAFTSQLAHVVSSAYIKSPTLWERDGYSAGSFLDLTRVAKLNEDMWTVLFRMNRKALLFEIDTIIQHLNEYKNAIEQDDATLLKDLLRDGRIKKEKSLETTFDQ